MPKIVGLKIGKFSAHAFRDISLGILLFLATFLAYSPALNGGFIWDDDHRIYNQELHTLYGLWRIWLDPSATDEYYPLFESTFSIEYQLWGDAPLGYHIVSVLQHVTACYIVVAIMRCLLLPGAWLSGFIFALHPVCVESVAWISEQKNTLSIVFYLSSLLAYLYFDETRKRVTYFIALALFICALFSKTVTVTLPVVLLIIFWWRRGRIAFRSELLPLLPFFVLGTLAGLFTSHLEQASLDPNCPLDLPLSYGQKILLVGRVICFYFYKSILPVNLMLIYPRWHVDMSIGWQYLFPICIVLVLIALGFLARQQRGPLAAFLIFICSLFPTMGFLDFGYFRNTYVADHLQYLACSALIVPFVSALFVALRLIPRRARAFIVASILLLLGMRTWWYSHTFQSAEMAYQNTLLHNPTCSLAEYNLGIAILKSTGQMSLAMSHFNAAIRMAPNDPYVQNDVGATLASFPDKTSEAIDHFNAALRICPNYAVAECNLGQVLAKMPEHFQEAVACYQRAMRIQPAYAEAHNNLGVVLMKVPGRLPEAINQLEWALATRPNFADAHYNLAIALSHVPGRYPDVIYHLKQALLIDPGLVPAREALKLISRQSGAFGY